MASAPEADRRRPQFDGLRFLLFMIVFAVHYAPQPERLWYFSYALPVFFVISGFLITRLLAATESYPLGTRLRVFYLRRILRICPAYFLVLAILLATGAARYPEYFATYLVNWKLWVLSLNPTSPEFIHWQDGGWLTGSWHLWSLSVEEQYYVLYPLVLYFSPPRWRVLMLMGLAVASIAARMLFMHFAPDSFYGALLPVCAEYLVWGGLLAWLDLQGRMQRLRPEPVLWAALAVLALAVICQYKFGPHGVLQFVTTHYQTPIAIALGFVIWSLWHLPAQHWVVQFLSWKPLAYFGHLSYTCYLLHLVALDIFVATGIELPFSPLINRAVGSLGVTLLGAVLIWYLVEQPIYRLRRFVPYAGRRQRPHAV
jgi:peptidoglycan/LPS O-acetylase OafA/YrhL